MMNRKRQKQPSNPMTSDIGPDNYPGTLECAKWYKALLQKLYGEVPTKYFGEYISLSVDGVARVWITVRKNGRAFIEVKHGEENFQEAVDHLNGEGISFGTRRGKYLTFNVNVQQLKDKATTHEWLASRLSPQKLMLRQFMGDWQYSATR